MGEKEEKKQQQELPFSDAPEVQLKSYRELYDWIWVIISSVVVIILVFTFLFRTASVDGSSMEPTLHHGDKLIVSHLFYQPEYGDIVVLTSPPATTEPLVKRIIAKGGDWVDIDFEAKIVSVNGEVLDEPYIAEATELQGNVTFPKQVPKGCVFVMGDNRNHSKDSRMTEVGMVDERYIMGKVLFRILPFSSIGSIK